MKKIFVCKYKVHMLKSNLGDPALMKKETIVSKIDEYIG